MSERRNFTVRVPSDPPHVRPGHWEAAVAYNAARMECATRKAAGVPLVFPSEIQVTEDITGERWAYVIDADGYPIFARKP